MPLPNHGVLVGVPGTLLDDGACETGVLDARLGSADGVEAPVPETTDEKVVGADDALIGADVTPVVPVDVAPVIPADVDPVEPADVAPMVGVSVVSVGNAVGMSEV